MRVSYGVVTAVARGRPYRPGRVCPAGVTVCTVQIDNDGVRLHIAEDGDPTAPPILLLHGITSFGGTWNWLVSQLVSDFRVLRLDFRGHGGSDRVADGYHSAGYLSDVVAVCEQVTGGPTIVIGHSLGGITAATLMQQRPELVRAAVLEDPPMRMPVAGASGGHALLDAFAALRQSIPGVQAAGMTVDAFAGLLGSVPTASGVPMRDVSEPDAIAAMAGSLLTVDAAVLDPVLNGTIDTIFDQDRGLLPPTLIVTGDPSKPDSICDPEAARRLAAISSATEVVTVAGAGHLIHDEIESREQFRSLTAAFLDRIPLGASS